MLKLLEAFQVWYNGTNSSFYLETQIQWLNICLNVVEKNSTVYILLKL